MKVIQVDNFCRDDHSSEVVARNLTPRFAQIFCAELVKLNSHPESPYCYDVVEDDKPVFYGCHEDHLKQVVLQDSKEYHEALEQQQYGDRIVVLNRADWNLYQILRKGISFLESKGEDSSSLKTQLDILLEVI